MAPIRKAKDVPPLAQIQRLTRTTVEIPIIFETPLITNPFDSKSLQRMLDGQTGKAIKKKPPKDPEDEYERAQYKLTDGRYGIPATAFKHAIIGAARYYEGISMTLLKNLVRVEADDPVTNLVAIEASEPWMRTDHVRNESGVADIRFRPQFNAWKAKLRVTFVSDILTADQLVSLVDAAGLGGVGEWRPSAPKNGSGSFGCFRVDK